MTTTHMERHASELLKAIDLCFGAGLIVPALLLIYSGIDAMGWLWKSDEYDSPGESFQAWVKTYALKTSSLEGESADQLALDLWAARCALLHAQTAESKLTRQSKAREIHYRGADGSGLFAVEGFNSPRLPIFVDPLFLRHCFA